MLAYTHISVMDRANKFITHRHKRIKSNYARNKCASNFILYNLNVFHYVDPKFNTDPCLSVQATMAECAFRRHPQSHGQLFGILCELMSLNLYTSRAAIHTV